MSSVCRGCNLALQTESTGAFSTPQFRCDFDLEEDTVSVSWSIFYLCFGLADLFSFNVSAGTLKCLVTHITTADIRPRLLLLLLLLRQHVLSQPLQFVLVVQLSRLLLQKTLLLQHLLLLNLPLAVALVVPRKFCFMLVQPDRVFIIRF